MKSKIILIIVFANIFFLSCNRKTAELKKEVELKGDIFVVTRGAGNYKLGLVEVTAIPDEIMQSYINAKKLERTNKLLDEKHSQYNSIETYFDDLSFPKGVATTNTDAEGKFILKLPKAGRYAIAARSERKVFDSTEKYFWIVGADVNENNSNTITLSNNNMFTTESLDKSY